MKTVRPEGVISRAEAIRRALDLMKPVGCGYNDSLMFVASGLRRAALGRESALQLALVRAEELDIPDKGIRQLLIALDKAFQSRGSRCPDRFEGNGFAKIVPDLSQTEEICRIGPTGLSIKNASPIVPLKTWPTLRLLFPERQTLLCEAENEFTPFIVRRDEELYPERLQFIVPNPMTGYTGRNQRGEITTRALSNTGPRRFLIVEYDFSYYDRSGTRKTVWYPLLERMAAIGRTPLDMCASLLSELALCEEAVGVTRLAMVVFSGNKSLQSWFYVGGNTDDEIKPFFIRAVRLGADHHLWNRSQLVRMPGGLRLSGEPGAQILKRQEIYYFDPDYTDLC